MKRILFSLLAVLMVLGTLPDTAMAQPTKDQLKSQFKAREAELRELKKKGIVGETIDGYVEVVPGAEAGAKVAALASEENKDRRLLYQILADEINKELPDAKVKATVETIAARNAVRNIERAEPDEFLRVGKDTWIRVRDYPRFQKLAGLKARGAVGETGAGLVEVVKGDAAAEAVVKDENAARTAEYRAIAGKEGTGEAAVAARMGKRNIANARGGEMVKDEGGAWRKK
jgi:uncharacterized protein YdbL (DUF1318 family)